MKEARQWKESAKQSPERAKNTAVWLLYRVQVMGKLKMKGRKSRPGQALSEPC